jgi:uncharacterized protein (TIGR03118 family)
MKMKASLALGFVLLSAPALAGATYTVTPLVSDQSGMAANTDTDLVNAWGISHAPGGPVWISDNGTDMSTVYDPNTGNKFFGITISPGAPTGTVYVPPGSGFNISKGANSGAAIFLFDTETGAIEGWNSNVDPNAVVAVNNSDKGAVYKGLAIDPASKQIYAANFSKNKVEVYDSTFHMVKTFTDTSLPKHFAPFNVALLKGKLYVAFAKRERHGTDEIDKLTLGYVDIFDTSGNLTKRLVANGKLDAPWGMTIAPKGFGTLGGALLVGNFGDGKINAYNAKTGDFMGTLQGASGDLQISGLWALDAGPNANVSFTAGPGDEGHGLFGLIHN